MAERSQTLFIEGLHEALNYLKEADDEGEYDHFIFVQLTFFNCVSFLVSSTSNVDTSFFLILCSLFLFEAKTGKRGKYNIVSQRTKIKENLHIREEDDKAPEGYFTTAKGNLLPSRWKALYSFLEFGKAPKEWKKVFEDDEEMGTVSTVSAAYIQPIAGK